LKKRIRLKKFLKRNLKRHDKGKEMGLQLEIWIVDTWIRHID
jgi:hypothetical protein